MDVVTSPAEIEPTVTVLPPDVLDDATRARLRDAVSRPDPVVDARRWTRAVFLLVTLVVWFPTMWSGTKAAEVAVQQWVAGIGLTLGCYVVMATANRFAHENARAVLRTDAIARAIAAAEAFDRAQAQLAAAREKTKAEQERKAAEKRAAKERLREEQAAAAALAELMSARADQEAAAAAQSAARRPSSGQA